MARESAAARLSPPVARAAPGCTGAAVLEGQLPDFFVVGHPKSGTTALYEMLRRHPQIHMCPEKEPWFFATELRFRAPPRTPVGIPDTLQEYAALFAGAAPGQRVGEASTPYLWSRTAARAIAQVRPDARIVAILREPASFLRSLHLQFVEAHIEAEPDFGRALALEPARGAGRQIPRHTYWPQMLIYSEHVRYAEQLRRYHAVFAPEQILVLIYDDFRRENEATVARVLRFLGVDDSVPVESVYANPTVLPRSQRLHEAVHAVSVGRGAGSRALKASIKALTPQRVRRTVLRAFRERVLYDSPPAVDEATMTRLRREHRPEVIALSELLGRDLVSMWGYDRLD